ncbi:hypothetical protein ACYUMT_07530 [Latilactobacillus sakei]
MKHEKIELPKFVCAWLDEHPVTVSSYPLESVVTLNNIRVNNHEVAEWLNANRCTQWKLINALQFGYVPEPEPRWGIKAGNCYLSSVLSIGKTVFVQTLNGAYFWKDESVADFQVEHLGFGEVVDLNKECKADDVFKASYVEVAK